MVDSSFSYVIDEYGKSVQRHTSGNVVVLTSVFSLHLLDTVREVINEPVTAGGGQTNNGEPTYKYAVVHPIEGLGKVNKGHADLLTVKCSQTKI